MPGLRLLPACGIDAACLRNRRCLPAESKLPACGIETACLRSRRCLPAESKLPACGVDAACLRNRSCLSHLAHWADQMLINALAQAPIWRVTRPHNHGQIATRLSRHKPIYLLIIDH